MEEEVGGMDEIMKAGAGLHAYDISPPMNARLIILIVGAAAFCAPVTTASAALPKAVMPFFNEHCFECHDDSVAKGGLDLTVLDFDLTKGSSFEMWQRIQQRVADGEMPPEKKPRPDAKSAKTFVAAVREPLLEQDRRDIAKHGRVLTRRLTRVEYENTLHDLLGIDIPVWDLLPEDPKAHGFETVADAQQLSHHQLARYLDVADIALDDAFTRALGKEKPYSKFISPKDTTINGLGNYRGPENRDGKSISWPITTQFFGRMGATTVPSEGWYRITLKDVHGINPGEDGAVWGTLRSGACSSAEPMLYMVGLVEATKKPRDLVFEAWIRDGHRLELKPNDAELKRAPSGARGGNVSFKGRNLEKEGYSGIAHRGIQMDRIHPYADRDAVRRNLFGDTTLEQVKKDPKGSVRRMVGRFARRAFRRPVADEQLAPYLGIAAASLKAGEPAQEALRAAYRAILCSPRFLTFLEKPGPLDDHAIASRMSYALWVSMPDWELTKLANEKKLRDPKVLKNQIDRMLNHPKAERFIASFTDQWLKLSEISFTTPDPRQFRTFDAVLQESMVGETRSYLAELIARNLGVDHLVDSDFTFLNGRLARHYRIKAGLRPGEGLQKVSLSKAGDKIRGGFATQGAILKVTADGTHTSPVVRGVFINERLLGAHIPAPPPGVPAIEPDIRGAKSIRDQLDKHRNNESCASCHQTIDPPGFALENLDPVGAWRTKYGIGGKGAPVDPSGKTPDGEAFADLVAWKKIYSRRDVSLAVGFLEKILTYGTGAAPRFSDEETLAKLARGTESENFGVRSLIAAALTSDIFLSK